MHGVVSPVLHRYVNGAKPPLGAAHSSPPRQTLFTEHDGFSLTVKSNEHASTEESPRVSLTVAGILTLAILLPLLVVGPRAGEAFAGRFGLERAFEVAWSALYFPVVVVLGLTLLTWVYHVVPPHSTRWRRDLPGAVLALLLWLAGSAGLRIYATQVATTESAYAYFGTPLVLMLWIYLTAVTFLVGAEFNAEIEKMHPSARRASQRSDPDRRGTRTRRGVSSRRTGQRDE